jgi:hypothetical protein
VIALDLLVYDGVGGRAKSGFGDVHEHLAMQEHDSAKVDHVDKKEAPALDAVQVSGAVLAVECGQVHAGRHGALKVHALLHEALHDGDMGRLGRCNGLRDRDCEDADCRRLALDQGGDMLEVGGG